MINKAYTTILLILFNISILAQQSSLYNNNYNNFEDQGLTRLNDFLFQLPEASFYTVNGFDYNFSLNNSITFRNNWKVFIDGTEIKMGLPYYKNLNTLPLNLQEIRSVSVNSGIINSYNTFGEGGAIFITTNKHMGFGGNISFSAGNESGDPGPFQFTNVNSQNVDKIGPDLSAKVWYNSESFYTSLSLDTKSHYATDQKQFHRNSSFPWYNRLPTFTGVKFESGYSFDDTNIKLNAYHSRIGQNLIGSVYGSESIYTPAVGNEIPADYYFNQVTVGIDKLVDHKKIMVEAGISSNYLKEARYYKPNDFYNLKKNEVYVKLGSEFKANTSDVNIFTNVNKDYYKSRYNIDYNYLEFGFGANVGVPVSDSNLLKLSGYSSFGTGEGIYSFSVQHVRNDNNGGLKFLSFIIEQGLSYTNEPYVKYYPELLLEREGITLNNNMNFYGNNVDDERLTLINYDLKFSLRENGSAGISQTILSLLFEYDNYQNYYYNDYYYDYLPETYSLDVVGEESGKAFGGVLSITPAYEFNLFGNIENKISYRFSKFIHGNDSFVKQTNKLAVHKIKYALIYHVEEGLTLGANASYESARPWYNYENMDGFYKSRIASTLKMDFHVNKWFWQKKIQLQLAVNNFTNVRTYTHPVGGRYDFTLYGTVRFHLRKK